MQHFVKIIFLFVSPMLPLFFSSCKGGEKDKGKGRGNAPVVVDVMIASPEPVRNILEVNGTVVANEFTEIRPEVSGRLTYLNIPEGSPVSQGTVLARINSADLAAQVAKSKVQLDLAEKTVGRFKQLLDVSGINQSDYDAAVNQVNSLKADMVYTQTLIDKTVIRAPFSGVLGLRQVSPGAYVSPATILATIQQTSQAKIDFTLPETYGNIIKKGLVVEVETDAAGNERGRAVVLATEPGANTDTRNLKVRALLQGVKSNPGGFVKVFIDEGKTRNSVKVPANAIIPDDKNNQLVVVKNGKAHFVNVRTGVRESDMIEILDGVQTGDSVVVSGVLFVRPKSDVKINSVKTQAQLATDQSKDSSINK
ncbi:MAG TPA: efflux RND transporter periplasmic adaptor subunit [Ferruginibacter sp.]|nr:efflux RND transporter periplasmic adaptor subunit [Ferruginibacter sp.]